MSCPFLPVVSKNLRDVLKHKVGGITFRAALLKMERVLINTSSGNTDPWDLCSSALSSVQPTELDFPMQNDTALLNNKTVLELQ